VIFIDSGAFLARYLANDQHHDAAVDRWEKLREEGQICLTSNFVIDETVTLLSRRSTPSFAVERAKSIYSSQYLRILRPEETDEISALHWMLKYADQSVSFTDCISFTLMKRQGISSVFSFDQHFVMAGFDVIS